MPGSFLNLLFGEGLGRSSVGEALAGVFGDLLGGSLRACTHLFAMIPSPFAGFANTWTQISHSRWSPQIPIPKKYGGIYLGPLSTCFLQEDPDRNSMQLDDEKRNLILEGGPGRPMDVS